MSMNVRDMVQVLVQRGRFDEATAALVPLLAGATQEQRPQLILTIMQLQVRKEQQMQSELMWLVDAAGITQKELQVAVEQIELDGADYHG